MNELDIQLLVNPTCELIAIDRTSYQNLHYDVGEELQYLRDRSKHVSIEFLTDVDGEIMNDSLNLEKGIRNREELLDGNTSVFHFPKDGTFTYYKFLVPCLFHMMKDGVFNVYKQTFFHNDSFYYSEYDEDVDIRSNDVGGVDVAINIILSKSNKISVNQLWTLQGTQTFSFQKNIFSVCKLQKCLLNLQRQIMNNPDNCTECGMESSLRFKRDFLLSALYVFDYLKDTNNYEEAQRVLDNMKGCGSYLCEDVNYDKTDCGCGTVVY